MASISVEGGRQVILDNCFIAETEDSFSVQEIYGGELLVHIIAKTGDTGKVVADYMEVKYGVKRSET